jgi:hypothetical protein
MEIGMPGSPSRPGANMSNSHRCDYGVTAARQSDGGSQSDAAACPCNQCNCHSALQRRNSSMAKGIDQKGGFWPLEIGPKSMTFGPVKLLKVVSFLRKQNSPFEEWEIVP